MKTVKEKVQMKNFKKYLLVLAGGALAVIVLGCGTLGCSSGGNDNGSESAVVTPPPVETPPPVGDDNPTPDPSIGGLAGVDTDGNGVWQYIDEYIESAQPNSEKARAALRQYAINMQNALLDADNKELSIQHARESEFTSACSYYVLPFDEAIKAQRALEAEILNTEERTRAFFTYDRQLGGEIFHGVPSNERKAACSFDPDTMAN